MLQDATGKKYNTNYPNLDKNVALWVSCSESSKGFVHAESEPCTVMVSEVLFMFCCLFDTVLCNM